MSFYNFDNFDNLIDFVGKVMNCQFSSENDSFIYRYSLPGYGKEDIEANVIKNKLIITDIKTKNALAIIHLNEEADVNTIKIKIDKGILTCTVEKKNKPVEPTKKIVIE